ncbi:MAG TPA: hypothetical protein VNW29_03855 [Candidatus Sulfotelmatobacter sp.]|nr:hypothetical protein [Candidatus Sulfotelmatobacter sp.]
MSKKIAPHKSHSFTKLLLVLALLLSFVSIYAVLHMETEMDQMSLSYQIALSQSAYAQECVQKQK